MLKLITAIVFIVFFRKLLKELAESEAEDKKKSGNSEAPDENDNSDIINLETAFDDSPFSDFFD